MFVIVALCFLRQQRQQEQRSDMNSMLSVDNNKNNFYQPKGWLPLDPTFTFVALNQRSPAERKGKAQKRIAQGKA